MGIVFVLIALLIALYPENAILGGLDALVICANVIIPSLLPFFICTKVIIKTKISDDIAKFLAPIMKPLFNVNGYSSIALFSGLLSGYPQGTKAIVSLYDEGKCSKAECERMLSFCNNSGPLFIIGAIGAGILKNVSIGYVLYFSHILSAITTGIIFRYYKKGETNLKDKKNIIPKNKKLNFGIIFSDAVSDSVLTIIIVCGYIVFMSVFLSLLEKVGAFFILEKYIFLNSPFYKGITRGFFEVSLGVKALGNVKNFALLKLVLIALVLGWGGLSVHFQSLGLINGKLSSKPYFIGKALSGIFTAIYTYIILKFMPMAIKTSSYPNINLSLFNFWKHSFVLLFFYIIFVILIKIVLKIKEK